jgi:hypothetical protein
MARHRIRDDHLLCVCEARKGVDRNIPVKREFPYQRFSVRDRQ